MAAIASGSLDIGYVGSSPLTAAASQELPIQAIFNVSSGLGSLTFNSTPNPYRATFNPGYAASKTALNAITLAFAIELEAEGIKVNAVTPGYTSTALNNFEGTETVEQGAAEAVRVELLGGDAPTGAFTGSSNQAYPW